MSKDLDYFLNIKRNQIKMVRARGYNITDELWILNPQLTGVEFEKKLSKMYEKEYPIRRLLFSEYQKIGVKNLVVYYVGVTGSKQIKIDSIRPFMDKMTIELKDGILITDNVLSSESLKQLSVITQCSYQIFKEEDLHFDLLEHTLVPQHSLLSKEEVEKKRKEWGMEKKLQLPMIPVTDKIASYYHYRQGDIIKVTTQLEIDSIQEEDVRYCLVI